MAVSYCGCPNSSRVVRIGTAVCAVRNVAAISASAAKHTVCRIILHTTCTRLFSLEWRSGGWLRLDHFWLRKNMALARFFTSLTERYEASLCAHRALLLASYRIVAVGWVAA